jgi:hypothetical protein
VTRSPGSIVPESTIRESSFSTSRRIARRSGAELGVEPLAREEADGLVGEGDLDLPAAEAPRQPLLGEVDLGEDSVSRVPSGRNLTREATGGRP